MFETVPQVDLSNNPWTLLPNRWGHQNNPEQNSKGFGYSLQAALDFLYAVGSFYSHAEKIWEELGVFYYSNRLGLEDFLIELKRRVPNIWHDGLRPYAEHLYFKVVHFNPVPILRLILKLPSTEQGRWILSPLVRAFGATKGK